MTHRRAMTRPTAVLAGAAGLAIALAGCTGTDAPSTGSGDNGENMTITLGFIPSWTDGLSTAYLLEDQLGKLGYTVKMETLTEAAPLYTGLANGDVDIYPSAWPEVTHAKYMEEYGDDIEDLGAYYENAKLTIAVPSYTNIDSLDQLAANADLFDGKIFGIEPGAGLTGVTQDSMMPAYGLEDWELVTSSTAAMLTQLSEAIDKQEDIVVTLWRPFWANAAFDIKDLDDPQGAMGEPESLHFLATKGFASAHPSAAEYIAQITLDDAAYGSLEKAMVDAQDAGTDLAAAFDAWLAENGTAYDGLILE